MASRRNIRPQLITSMLAFVTLFSHSANAIDRPSMMAKELAAAPTVDGEVKGDYAWCGAERAEGFWQVQPDAGQAASQATEVLIGYTEDAFYLAVLAYDDSPEDIVVSDSRRDSNLSDTDSFLFIIDGLLDGRNGFVFGTNAAGMQFDAQVTNEGQANVLSSGPGGFRRSWDGEWEVQTSRSDQGWSAEFRIPFRTLRYRPGEEQTWGINFQRNIRRTNEVVFWSALPPQHRIYRVSQAGQVVGINAPKPRNLQLTPYVLATSARSTETSGTTNDGDSGFDLKYSMTPSLTLDMTYNTDFAQAEADRQRVNLDRFSLFFPEKRSFFLENAGLFAVGNPREVELFFSRRIGIAGSGDPLAIEGGLRLSGKVGRATNVGFLHMQSEGIAGVAPENQFSVARVSQELADRSNVGILIVNRQGDGTSLTDGESDNNQTFAVDGSWGIGESVLLQGWAAKTRTAALDGRDDAFSVKGAYKAEDWEYRLGYTQVGDDFNPEVGFLSRSGYRRADAYIARRIRLEGKNRFGLYEIRPQAEYRAFWNFDGFQETGFSQFEVDWRFRSGHSASTAVNVTKEGVVDAFDIVDGVTVEAGNYDHTEASIRFSTNPADPLSFSMSSVIGGRFGGDRVSLGPSVDYRIGESFTSSLSYNFNKFDLPNGSFEANLARLRLSYSFSPNAQLQTFIQYNDRSEVLSTNIRFSWLRAANTGLFVVFNDVNDRGIDSTRDQQFLIKYSHTFDLLR